MGVTLRVNPRVTYIPARASAGGGGRPTNLAHRPVRQGSPIKAGPTSLIKPMGARPVRPTGSRRSPVSEAESQVISVKCGHTSIRRKFTELAKALVAVDTSYPPGNEATVEGVLREALARWRPSWERVEPTPGRLSLIARLPPGDPGAQRPHAHSQRPHRRGAGGGRRGGPDPFDPEIADDRLYGRGSADMKGGVAAAICALDTLEAAG